MQSTIYSMLVIFISINIFDVYGDTLVCQSNCPQNSDFNSDYIYCDGYFGCRGSKLTATSSLNIGGKRSAENSLIKSPQIKCVGAFGANSAIFDSDGLSTMNMQFWGFNCGHNAEVHCKYGSQCILDCTGFLGCNGVTVNYYDNINKISIFPSGCLDSNNYDKKVDGHQCPKDIKYAMDISGGYVKPGNPVITMISSTTFTVDWTTNSRPDASGTFNGDTGEGSCTFPDDTTYTFTFDPNVGNGKISWSNGGFWPRGSDISGEYVKPGTPVITMTSSTTFKVDWTTNSRPDAFGTWNGESGSCNFPDDQIYTFTFDENTGNGRILWSNGGNWPRGA